MRIGVLGVGRIGSAFAFQLARFGRHDVTVIARPGSARLEQLRRSNAIVNSKNERAEVRVCDALDDEAYDLVIVTLLAHQVRSALPALQRSAASAILFAFSTFEPERLQDAVGAERCTFGMPFIQATVDDDGILTATVGAMGAKTLLGRQRWVDLFDSVGLPATLEPNMLPWLRCHVPLTIAFESVSVAGVRRGGGASWREAIVLARGVRECFALIESLGYTVYPAVKRRIASSPPWAFAIALWLVSRLASFRTLLATGEGECRALVDAVVEAAARSTSPVRVEAIRAMAPPSS